MQVRHFPLSPRQSLLAFGLVSLYSLVQFSLQIVGNILLVPWMQSFHLGSVGVGFLSSTFFYGYALVQIPAGWLLDIYGIRRVVLLGLAVCALGCLGFALSTSLIMAVSMRFISGVGAGFAFVSMVYSAGAYFLPNKFSLMVGVGEFIGMFGAAISQFFLPRIVATQAWTGVYWGAAGILLALWVGCFKVLPKSSKRSADKLLSGARFVFAHKVPWLAGFYAVGTFGVISLFSSLWGTAVLVHTLGYQYKQAGSLMALTLLGIAVGGPSLGALGDKVVRRAHYMRWLSFLLLLVSIGMLLFGQSLVFLCLLLFLLGIFSSGYIQSFAILSECLPSEQVGLATGLCNAIGLVFGGVVAQPLFGEVLALSYHYGLSHKVAYQLAMGTLYGMILLGLFCAYLLPAQKNEEGK